jgi:hypothetical protein
MLERRKRSTEVATRGGQEVVEEEGEEEGAEPRMEVSPLHRDQEHQEIRAMPQVGYQ